MKMRVTLSHINGLHFFAAVFSLILFFDGGGYGSSGIAIILMFVSAWLQISCVRWKAERWTAIEFFVLAYIFLYGMKAAYLLYIKQEIVRASLAFYFNYYSLEPYIFQAVFLALLSFSVTLLTYNIRSKRYLNHPVSPRITFSRPHYQLLWVGLVISVLSFLLWIILNGGISFVLRSASQSYLVRTGELTSNYPVLKRFYFPSIFFFLSLLIYARARPGASSFNLVLILGAVISYLHANSVSETLLFLIAVGLLKQYVDGSGRAQTIRWIVTALVLFQLAVLLKSFYTASAGAAQGADFSGKLNDILYFYYSDLVVQLSGIIEKFNSVEVLAISIRDFGGAQPYYGWKFYLSGLTSFLPKGLLGLSEFSTGTLGNQWARYVFGDGVTGGMNLTIVGSFYSVFSVFGVMTGGVAFGWLLSWSTQMFIVRNNISAIALAVYVAFVVYIVLFFIRTGGPVITFRRFFWILIPFLIISVLSSSRKK